MGGSRACCVTFEALKNASCKIHTHFHAVNNTPQSVMERRTGWPPLSALASRLSRPDVPGEHPIIIFFFFFKGHRPAHDSWLPR
eukprot:5629983-Prymnesium_polylepis.1